jgi:transcriptional regulator with XRE-family HTH domain|tara:strand:+ start:159 stop:758 length:600 start_codon:yes stop_codon:yes gene_type:complete
MNQEETVKRLRDMWQRERVNQGITQAQAAEAIGMQQPPFSQYINGVIPLNLPFLIQLCELLDVDPTEVYPGIADEVKVKRTSIAHFYSDANRSMGSFYVLDQPLVKQTAILLDERAEWTDVSGNTNAFPKGTVLICCKPSMYRLRFPDAKSPPKEGIYCIRIIGYKGFLLMNEDQYNEMPGSEIDIVYIVTDTSFRLLD